MPETKSDLHEKGHLRVQSLAAQGGAPVPPLDNPDYGASEGPYSNTTPQQQYGGKPSKGGRVAESLEKKKSRKEIDRKPSYKTSEKRRSGKDSFKMSSDPSLSKMAPA